MKSTQQATQQSNKKTGATKTWGQRCRALPPMFWGCCAVLCTWGVYFFYLWPRVIMKTARGVESATTPYVTDWAAHFTYIAVFAYRPVTNWFQTHPIHIQKHFTYPFVADALSGILIRFGIDSIAAVIIPSIILTLVLLFLLLAFYNRFLKSVVASFFALSLFLMNGAFGLMFPVRDFRCCAWTNIVTSEFLPQRAMLLGFPIALIILYLLYRWTKNNFKDATFMRLVALGLISACLFLIHPHSTLALVLFCVVLALFSRAHWEKWAIYAVSAAIPLFFINFVLIQGQIDYQMIRLQLGWMSSTSIADMNVLWFWFINWGFFLPLSIIAIWRTKQYKNPLVVGGILIFLLANIFSFQPWVWDNSKLFTWSYCIFIIPVLLYMQRLWKQKNIAIKFLVVVLFFVMTATGAADLYHMARTPSDRSMLLWTTQEIALAEEFKTFSEPTDIVLTSDRYNHWVPSLTGRQILLGNRKWNGTYGFFFNELEQDIINIYSGSENAEELIKKYNISFIVIGPYEREVFTIDDQFFSQRYPVALTNDEYQIYSTKK